MKHSTYWQKFGATLSIADFVKLAKATKMTYIIGADLYDKEGRRLEISLDKKVNKKWMQISSNWKSDTKKRKAKAPPKGK